AFPVDEGEKRADDGAFPVDNDAKRTRKPCRHGLIVPKNAGARRLQDDQMSSGFCVTNLPGRSSDFPCSASRRAMRGDQHAPDRSQGLR
ncbi:MAG TPA: hypothetical protein VK753_06870, partial [Xanthomonadaceae bacterium]|nr:hypothetical protein [Xanthomonadaceae bacterium]